MRRKESLRYLGSRRRRQNFKIGFFLRVGDWGGHLLVEWRRPTYGAQVLFDAAGLYHGGAPCDSRGRCGAGGTRSDGLEGRAD
jgi:hypothetical protein